MNKDLKKLLENAGMGKAKLNESRDLEVLSDTLTRMSNVYEFDFHETGEISVHIGDSTLTFPNIDTLLEDFGDAINQ